MCACARTKKLFGDELDDVLRHKASADVRVGCGVRVCACGVDVAVKGNVQVSTRVFAHSVCMCVHDCVHVCTLGVYVRVCMRVCEWVWMYARVPVRV